MRILVVDDELYALESLLRALQRAAFLKEAEIYEANSGKDALRQALSFPPDILISDVKMPGMNGFDLVEQMKTLAPDCRVILLSAYSDKEYLRSALRLHVVEYIDKPFDEEKLYAILLQTIADIEHSEHQKEQLFSYQQRINDAKNILSQFWIRMFRNGESDFGLLYDASNRYDMGALFESAFRCMVFSTGNKTLDAEKLPLPNGVQALPIEKSHGNYSTLFCYATNMSLLSDTFVKTFFSELRENGLVEYMAAGNVVASCEECHHAYKTAKSNFDRFFFGTDSHLLLPKDCLPSKQLDMSESRGKIYKSITDLNPSKAKEQCTELFSMLKVNCCTPVQAIRELAADICNLILRISNQYSFDFHKQHNDREMYQTVWNIMTIDDLHSQLAEWIDENFQCEYGNDKTIRLAIAYMRQHFCEPNLNLESLSGFTGYSTSYLCTLFKRTVGITINNYITKIRIEASCKLLENTDDTMEGIAVSVGFANAKYFSRVFKQVMLTTPIDYRKSTKR